MREGEELKRWEHQLSKELQKVEVPERQNAGALLRVIPRRTEWEVVHQERNSGRRDPFWSPRTPLGGRVTRAKLD